MNVDRPTELVSLLRKQVQMHYDKQPDGSFVRGPNIPDPLCEAAADEIERLRAEIKEMRLHAAERIEIRDNSR